MRAARTAFIRGMVATGVLAVTDAGGRSLSRAEVRRALKAGIAVAGGTMVAEALERDEPVRAMLALAGGIAAAMAVDGLLQATDREQEQESDGKEEIG